MLKIFRTVAQYEEYLTLRHSIYMFSDKRVPFCKENSYVTFDGEIVSKNVVSATDKSEYNKYRLRKQREWRNRLAVESYGRKGVYFCTLTYNNDFVKKVPDIRDLQLFIKRLRKYIPMYKGVRPCTPDGLPFRYFFVPEFGDKNGRLHWHGILFGLPKRVRDIMCNPQLNSDGSYRTRNDGRIYNIWTYGFVSCTPIKPTKFGYCTKYMYKDPICPIPLKSSNIGLHLCNTNAGKKLAASLFSNGSTIFHYGGKIFRIPFKSLKLSFPHFWQVMPITYNTNSGHSWRLREAYEVSPDILDKWRTQFDFQMQMRIMANDFQREQYYLTTDGLDNGYRFVKPINREQFELQHFYNSLNLL